MNELQIAILVVSGMAGSEAIRLTTRHVFGRITRDDIVTKADCASCDSRRAEELAEMRKDIREIKVTLFALARGDTPRLEKLIGE